MPDTRTETVYSAAPALSQPARFFREALRDLNGSLYLAFILLQRDIKHQYRQSLFGLFWALLPPLVMTFAFSLLKRQNLIAVDDIGVHYEAYVLTGTLLWQGFADAVASPIKAVNGGKAMFGKVNFPREAILFAGLGEVVFYFAIRFVMVILLLLVFQVPLSVSAMILVGISAIIGLGWAIGLWLVPAGVLYKDVEMATGIVLSLWYFATPVIYTPVLYTVLPDVTELNPVAPIIVFTRAGLLEGRAVLTETVLLIILLTAATIFFGWLLFRLSIPHIVKRV